MGKSNKDQNESIYNTGIDNFSNKEQQQVYEETQAGIDNIRQSTIDYSLSTASAKSDLTIERTGLEYEKDIHTLVGFLSVIDKLLEDIKDIKKGISKKGLSKEGKKVMKDAKTKLDGYKKQLKNKKNALLKQKNAEIYDNDIATVKNIWWEVYKIKENIGIQQRGDFGSTSNYPHNSPESNKRPRRHQNDVIIDGGENSDSNHQNSGYTSNPQTRCSTGCKEGIVVPTHKSVDYKNMDRGETLKKGGISGALDKVLSNFNNLTPGQRETWKNLGVLACVAGSLYGLYKFYTNKNMSLRTKAGITVGTIFGTEALLGESPLSLFNKAMTGGLSLEELQNKFGNAVSRAGLFGSNSSGSTGETTSGGTTGTSGETTGTSGETTGTSGETTGTSGETGESSPETTIPAMFTSMMIFNSNTKKSDIDKMTEEFNNDKDNKKRKFFYEQSSNKLKKEYGEQTMEYFQTIFSDKYDKEKWENRIAGFGITKDTKQDEPIYGLANNAIMNEIILKKFQEENGLIVTNKDALKDYKNKQKNDNKAIDIDKLNGHISNDGKDWFKVDVTKTHTERPEDIQNKKDLVSKVEGLSIDTVKKEELKQAIQEFYDERQIKNKPKLNDFSLKIENKLLIMKSHDGNETKIDLDNNSIKCNNSEFQLNSLSEALNTADLTNYILGLTNKKKPINFPIFTYKPSIQNVSMAICFNDAKTVSTSFDTSVLDIKSFKDRKTIDKNASAYAIYLSEHRKEVNKLNLTNYPLVKQLGIDFFGDDNEVQKLENRLKGVKQKLSVYTSADKDPFTIGKRSNKLLFKRQGNGGKGINESFFPEDIFNEFPTLSRTGNKDKFLQFMNNPNNKMRRVTN